jgi:hypothetical protein
VESVHQGGTGIGVDRPDYNIIVILQIVGKPWWWIIGMIIPLVNFVVFIMLAVELAGFRQGTAT